MTIDIDDSYYYKLHMLKSASDTLFDQALSIEVGISLSHFILLATVRKYQPVSQQRIAQFLDITAGAISRQVDIVRQKGLLTVENDKADNRKQLVRLTPEGEKVFLAGDKVLVEAGRKLFKSSEEIRAAASNMDTVRKRIEEISPKT